MRSRVRDLAHENKRVLACEENKRRSPVTESVTVDARSSS